MEIYYATCKKIPQRKILVLDELNKIDLCLYQIVLFAYNSKSSSVAVRTGLRPVKAHVTFVRFDYNSKSLSAAT